MMRGSSKYIFSLVIGATFPVVALIGMRAPAVAAEQPY